MNPWQGLVFESQPAEARFLEALLRAQPAARSDSDDQDSEMSSGSCIIGKKGIQMLELLIERPGMVRVDFLDLGYSSNRIYWLIGQLQEVGAVESCLIPRPERCGRGPKEVQGWFARPAWTMSHEALLEKVAAHNRRIRAARRVKA